MNNYNSYLQTDEETATAWINQQLESLGVNLI